MNILDFFYPPRCPFCGSFIEKNQLMCFSCEDKVQRLPIDECPMCGELRKDCICPEYFLDHLSAVYYYNDPVDQGVKSFKFAKRMQGIDYFTAQMTAYVQYHFGEYGASLVAPVPMGAKRRNQRGFNQAELLGRVIAKDLRIPMDTALIKKVVDTNPQSLQAWYGRKGNIAGAYEIHKDADLRGLTVLLVDDVCTSGATLEECAKMLKYAGADKVMGVVLCKAGKKLVGAAVH